MVRAVEVQVTVDAALVVYEPNRGGVGGLGGREAVRRRVTPLEETRSGDLQQLLLVASVRFVAVGAVLDDWRVLVQERPALLGVAGEARFVHGTRDEKFLVRRPMRVVTAAALELPVHDRHVRE